LCGKPRGELGLEIGGRPEIGLSAAPCLSRRDDLRLGQMEVQRLPARLRDIPWAVHKQLDTITIGVAEIGRPGDAVVYSDRSVEPFFMARATYRFNAARDGNRNEIWLTTSSPRSFGRPDTNASW
jgi:hypothetical protein